MKTSELTGVALDWAVAEASQTPIYRSGKTLTRMDMDGGEYWCPSTNWSQGGPIIERETIELKRGNSLYFPKGNEHGDYYEPLWIAGKQHGQTPLVAAMRCYVASKLGDEVDVPKELKTSELTGVEELFT